MGANRHVIIGLDGMPYGLIENLSNNGTMPHTKEVIDQGVFRRMKSSIPEISSVAWSSIITGKNPAEHGVFGFTDLAPGTYRMTFPNFNSLKSPPFWEGDLSRKYVIINVPSTYPARELNGVHIAGFVALDLGGATYPNSLLPTLREMDYRVDVNYERVAESIPYFFSDLKRTLEARINVFRYLWSKEKWDTFILVFTGVDRLAHYLWDAYEEPDHEYHDAFLAHLSQIDAVIGEIKDQLTDDDTLILLSDHGFERMEKEVLINRVLIDEGFLSFNQGPPWNIRNISDDTKAFALDPGRIYIHKKGKYPRGCISKNDFNSVKEDLVSILNSLRFNGRSVVSHIYHKEEVFKGPLMDRAPDIVPIGATGFNLLPSLNSTDLFADDIRTGKHSHPDAFLLVSGRNADMSLPESLTVKDVVGILEERVERSNPI